jgi:hypothetical protein
MRVAGWARGQAAATTVAPKAATKPSVSIAMVRMADRLPAVRLRRAKIRRGGRSDKGRLQGVGHIVTIEGRALNQKLLFGNGWLQSNIFRLRPVVAGRQNLAASCTSTARLWYGPGEFFAMSIHSVLITPAVALIAGILILLIPRLLNLIVALYLILIGLLGIAPHLMR